VSASRAEILGGMRISGEQVLDAAVLATDTHCAKFNPGIIPTHSRGPGATRAEAVVASKQAAKANGGTQVRDAEVAAPEPVAR